MLRPDGRYQKTRREYDFPGHAHELTFTCRKRYRFLCRERTQCWFIESLDRARRRLSLELWAYVIMPEHAHVLLLPREIDYSVAAIRKSIKQPVAQPAIHFLRRSSPTWMERLRVTWPNGRVEHRFWEQGGGYDRNIYDARTAWAAVAYLHNNPVRRGLVAVAEDWPWSSAGWYAGIKNVKLVMDGSPPGPPLT